MTVKLNDLKDPDTRAKLDVDRDIFEVTKGETFLENRCFVKDPIHDELWEKVQINCKEDDNKNKNPSKFI